MSNVLLSSLIPAFFSNALTSKKDYYSTDKASVHYSRSAGDSFLTTGAKTLASALTGGSTDKDSGYVEDLQKLFKNITTPKASKYIGGSTTPSVNRPALQLAGVANPRIGNAMRDILSRLNTDRHLEQIKTQYVSPTIQQGKTFT